MYSRGVLVLQETKFIPLSIWAQRLHDGNDASWGEWGCAVKGWTWGRKNRGSEGQREKTKPQTNDEDVAMVGRRVEGNTQDKGVTKEEDENQQVGSLSWKEEWKEQDNEKRKSRGRDSVLEFERNKDVSLATWQVAQQLMAGEALTCQCWLHRPFIMLLHKMAHDIFLHLPMNAGWTRKKETLTNSPVFPWLLCCWGLSVSEGPVHLPTKTVPVVLQLTHSLISSILSTYPFLRSRSKQSLGILSDAQIYLHQ